MRMQASISVDSSYRILGLNNGSSWQDVKSAFRKLALTCHPDVAGIEASERFEQISRAYMTLKSELPLGEKSSSRRSHHSRREAPEQKSWFCNVRRGWTERRKDRERKAHERAASAERERSLKIEEVLSVQETTLERLFVLAGRMDAGRDEESFYLKRLNSKLPEVRNLAMESLGGFLESSDIIDGLERSILKWGIDDNGLSILMSMNLDIVSSSRLAAASARRASELPRSSALGLVRWIKSLPDSAPKLLFLLRHHSEDVVAAALRSWPLDGELPEVHSLSRLLKSDSEAVLVPLLRLLRKKGVPLWARGSISRLAGANSSSVVRTWARTIVSRPTVL